jgi:hypothetical protein
VRLKLGAFEASPFLSSQCHSTDVGSLAIGPHRDQTEWTRDVFHPRRLSPLTPHLHCVPSTWCFCRVLSPLAVVTRWSMVAFMHLDEKRFEAGLPHPW